MIEFEDCDKSLLRIDGDDRYDVAVVVTEQKKEKKRTGMNSPSSCDGQNDTSIPIPVY